MLHTCTI